MTQHHMGEALMVIRVHRGLSPDTVAQKISAIQGQPVTSSFITSVESGEQSLSENVLENFAQVLNTTVVRIRKVAQDLEQSEDQPTEEILKEIITETDYRLWKRQQTEE